MATKRTVKPEPEGDEYHCEHCGHTGRKMLRDHATDLRGLTRIVKGNALRIKCKRPIPYEVTA